MNAHSNAPALGTEQKALAVLRAIAEGVAKGEAIGICPDWCFGTATVTRPDGAHTHVGGDCSDSAEQNFAAFVDGLHELLCQQTGLNWVASVNPHEHTREGQPSTS